MILLYIFITAVVIIGSLALGIPPHGILFGTVIAALIAVILACLRVATRPPYHGERPPPTTPRPPPPRWHGEHL